MQSNTISFKNLANSIDPELAKELVKATSDNMEQKDFVLKLAKKLIVHCDDIDEEICTAIDYLQCQVDHLKNQKTVLDSLRGRKQFAEEFSDIRYEIHQLRDSLLESIRYGKRTKEIDEIILRLGELIITSKVRDLQPSVNFTGIENALSPRCSLCSTSCISAFRKVNVFLAKLIKAIQATHEADSNSQVG